MCLWQIKKSVKNSIFEKKKNFFLYTKLLINFKKQRIRRLNKKTLVLEVSRSKTTKTTIVNRRKVLHRIRILQKREEADQFT